MVSLCILMSISGFAKVLSTITDEYIQTNSAVLIFRKYPDNLIEEISNYEAVGSVLAHRLDFDVIHSHDWLTYPTGALQSKSVVNH